MYYQNPRDVNKRRTLRVKYSLAPGGDNRTPGCVRTAQDTMQKTKLAGNASWCTAFRIVPSTCPGVDQDISSFLHRNISEGSLFGDTEVLATLDVAIQYAAFLSFVSACAFVDKRQITNADMQWLDPPVKRKDILYGTRRSTACLHPLCVQGVFYDISCCTAAQGISDAFDKTCMTPQAANFRFATTPRWFSCKAKVLVDESSVVESRQKAHFLLLSSSIVDSVST